MTTELSTWPDYVERGEYDSDYGRIICEHCDWFDIGGSISCAWTYRDHLEQAHTPSTTDGGYTTVKALLFNAAIGTAIWGACAVFLIGAAR